MSHPQIEWVKISGKECLRFKFSGALTESDALEGIAQWRREFAQRPLSHKIILVWDCLAMGDYDREARLLWQETCKELKDRIEVIWLLTDSMLIRMGATVISVFSSLKIKVCKSDFEIKIG